MKRFLENHEGRKARVAQLRSEGGLRAVLKAEAGAIDLASIMVGVIVIGLISGVIAATVFAVIPWAQDEAAKGTLDSVRTAQSVYYAQNSGTTGATGAKYATLTELTTGTNPLLQAPPAIPAAPAVAPAGAVTITLAGTPAGSQYTARVKSGSGKIFQITHANPTPTVVTAL